MPVVVKKVFLFEKRKEKKEKKKTKKKKKERRRRKKKKETHAGKKVRGKACSIKGRTCLERRVHSLPGNETVQRIGNTSSRRNRKLMEQKDMKFSFIRYVRRKESFPQNGKEIVFGRAMSWYDRFFVFLSF